MAEKTRYSDEELQEFKELILEKLDKARKDYDLLKGVISGSDGNDIADTCPTFKVLEEGASVLSKEEAGRLAQRQAKFIAHLEAKERLRAVPHATLSIEAKEGKEN